MCRKYKIKFLNGGIKWLNVKTQNVLVKIVSVAKIVLADAIQIALAKKTASAKKIVAVHLKITTQKNVHVVKNRTRETEFYFYRTST